MPAGMLAKMISQARRSVGVSARRFPTVEKSAFTILTHSPR